MVRAYYGDQISPNQTVTPEGYLICRNVPISRVGWYEYLGREIGLTDEPEKLVQVYRGPEEVFHPAAIASFEGKVLTDEHPPENVTVGNNSQYSKGTVTNVRQGKGADNDLLLADLVAYDDFLIQEIQNGKREVSCGYDLIYEPIENGAYKQTQIRGNHVAVVSKGRAGNRVRIQDAQPQNKPGTKGAKRMKIKIPSSIQSRVTDAFAALGLKQWAADAEPDEVMDAVNAWAEERTTSKAKDAEPEKEDNENKANDDAEDVQHIEALSQQVSALTDLVKSLVDKGGAKDEDPEAQIDAAINELEGAKDDDQDEEESHTIPAENMDEEGPVAPEDERPKAADNFYAIQALKAMKPIIAQIQDPKQKKQAADAALAALKTKPKQNTYSRMQKGQAETAKAKDKSPAQPDYSDLGKKWAKEHNPHYKGKGE